MKDKRVTIRFTDEEYEVLKTRHNKLGFVGLKYNKKTNTYYEARKINNNLEVRDVKCEVRL